MQPATISYQPETIITVTRKGQITLPAHARKLLNTENNPKLAVVIEPDGTLKLKPPKYPTLESLAGAAGSLPDSLKGLSWQEIIDIAHEDLAEQIVAKDQ
jgi:AbrB family looped-hinge helix DNA binding protein